MQNSLLCIWSKRLYKGHSSEIQLCSLCKMRGLALTVLIDLFLFPSACKRQISQALDERIKGLQDSYKVSCYNGLLSIWNCIYSRDCPCLSPTLPLASILASLSGGQFGGCRDDSGGAVLPCQTFQSAEQETQRYPFQEHLADYNNLNLVDNIKPSGAVLTGVSLLFFNGECTDGETNSISCWPTNPPRNAHVF